MDKRIGAQLYTIRNYCQNVEDFDKAMEAISKIGYKTVQISGVKLDDPKAIKEICDKYGLEIICTHRSFAAFDEDFEAEVERHKIYDCPYAGIGGLAGQLTETKEIFFDTIEKLNEFSDKLKERGLTFTYHNHNWEFRKFDEGKKSYMDYMLEKGRFSLMVDVYWLAFAGINPAKFIREHGERIECIHFKDLKVKLAERGVTMCEIGCGNLDWDDIIKACEEVGVKYAFVEQDTCETDSIECLETSYKFLTTKGFN